MFSVELKYYSLFTGSPITRKEKCRAICRIIICIYGNCFSNSGFIRWQKASPKTILGFPKMIFGSLWITFSFLKMIYGFPKTTNRFHLAASRFHKVSNHFHLAASRFHKFSNRFHLAACRFHYIAYRMPKMTYRFPGAILKEPFWINSNTKYMYKSTNIF
jgi:hypothetical protein